MSVTEKIIKIAAENNGIITTKMVIDAGFSKGNLPNLVDKGLLERATRGVYILPEIWEDEFFKLQSRFKRGIFSHETALFLLDLTDRTPNYYHMTFPNSYNTENPRKELVRCFRTKEALYNLGIINLQTPSGNTVKGYGMERTLCDILRLQSCTDIQVITDAFKRYTKKENKNIPLLSEYAKTFRVDKKLRSYLEVLL